MLTLPLARLEITSVLPLFAMRAMPGASPAPITPITRRLRKVDHRDIVGTGVGDVSALTLRIDVDKVGLPLHGNGRSDGVGFGIDHGHRTAAGIHHVNLVPARVDRQSGRIGADGDDAVLPHVDQVENSYGIAAAIADVGVLAIICRIGDIAFGNRLRRA